jgi:hypothetical protein
MNDIDMMEDIEPSEESKHASKIKDRKKVTKKLMEINNDTISEISDDNDSG